MPGRTGRLIVVWGPAGAPGRTTVATALAGELSRRRRRTILVDADPYGGTVAQQLGVTDAVSGLLSAARSMVDGTLEDRFTSVQRRVTDWLSVVTGLPRAERYAEVRPGTIEHLLEVARAEAEVVVDTGFSLETEPRQQYAARPGRNHLTLAAVAAADELVVVGSADPMGLVRLARGLADVGELREGGVRVVVNRTRPTLDWSERELGRMVRELSPCLGVHFLPEDRPAVDRALATGRMLLELGDSALTCAVAELVDALRLDQAANSR